MTKFLKDGLRDNKNDEPTDDSEALGEVEGIKYKRNSFIIIIIS